MCRKEKITFVYASKLAVWQLPFVKFFAVAKKSGQKPGFKKQKWAEQNLKLSYTQAKRAEKGLKMAFFGVF